MGDINSGFMEALRGRDGRPENEIAKEEWDLGCAIIKSQDAGGAVSISDDCAVVGETSAVRDLYQRSERQLRSLLKETEGFCLNFLFDGEYTTKKNGRWTAFEFKRPFAECEHLPGSPADLLGWLHMEKAFSELLVGSAIAVAVQPVPVHYEDDQDVELTFNSPYPDVVSFGRGAILCRKFETLRVKFLVLSDDLKMRATLPLPKLLASIEGKPKAWKKYQEDCPTLEEMPKALKVDPNGSLLLTMKSGREITITAGGINRILRQLATPPRY